MMEKSMPKVIKTDLKIEAWRSKGRFLSFWEVLENIDLFMNLGGPKNLKVLILFAKGGARKIVLKKVGGMGGVCRALELS